MLLADSTCLSVSHKRISPYALLILAAHMDNTMSTIEIVAQTEIDNGERRVLLTDSEATLASGEKLNLLPTETPGIWEWVVGRNRYPVHIASDGIRQVVVTIRGYSYNVDVYEFRHHQLLTILRSSTLQAHRVTKVTSPMPGLLTNILVANGARVRKGETLFTLEAMKMENAIKTPVTGTIHYSDIIAGSAIEKGAALCTIEAEH